MAGTSASTKVSIQALPQAVKDALLQAQLNVGHNPNKENKTILENLLLEHHLEPTDLASWYNSTTEQQHEEATTHETPHASLSDFNILPKLHDLHGGHELQLDMLTDEMKATPEFQKKLDEVTKNEKWKKKRADIVKEYQRNLKKTFDSNDKTCKEFMDQRLNKLAEHEFRRNNKQLAKALDKKELESANKSSIYEDHVGKQYIQHADEMAKTRTERLEKKLEKLEKNKEKLSPDKYKEAKEKHLREKKHIYDTERENFLKKMANDPRVKKKFALYAEFDPTAKSTLSEVRRSIAAKQYRKNQKISKKEAEKKLKAKTVIPKPKTVQASLTTLAPAAQMPIMGRKTIIQQDENDENKRSTIKDQIKNEIKKRIKQKIKDKLSEKFQDLFGKKEPTETQSEFGENQANEFEGENISEAPSENFGEFGESASEVAPEATEGFEGFSEFSSVGEAGAGELGGVAGAGESFGTAGMTGMEAFGAAPAAITPVAAETGAATGTAIGGFLVALFGPPFFIGEIIIGLLILVILVFVIISHIQQQQQQQANNPNTKPIPGFVMNLSQTPVNPVPNNTNITYTLNISYTGADAIVVTDPINTGIVTFNSATGTRTNSINPITWNLNDNTPTSTQGNTKIYKFTITIFPLHQDINYINTITANDMTLNSSSSASTTP